MNRFFRNLFRFILFLMIAGVLVIGYARYLEPHMLHIKKVTVTSQYLPDAAENLKIAVFGDTHFGPYYSADDFDKVLSAIKKLKPDIVVFTGDLIDHYELYSDDVNVISKKLSVIDAPLGKFAVFGNHDYGGGAENEYQDIMEAGGFTVLKNQYYGLEKLGVAIIGIDDVLIGYGDPSIASWGRPDYYNIILAHEPDLADDVLNYNVDLMISGHTHGRQINLKFFDSYILPPYGKEYISGLYQFHNGREAKLYVNSGIGMTKLPFRFLSPPELTSITLKSQ